MSITLAAAMNVRIAMLIASIGNKSANVGLLRHCASVSSVVYSYPPKQRANSSQGEDAKPPVCGCSEDSGVTGTQSMSRES